MRARENLEMISPMIHRLVRRDDLAILVAEIKNISPAEGRRAARSLEQGNVDALLDDPVALEIALGRGGAPAPLPLTLLWYIPVRAAMVQRGTTDIDLTDYTASLPIAFLEMAPRKMLAHRDAGLETWWHSIKFPSFSTMIRVISLRSSDEVRVFPIESKILSFSTVNRSCSIISFSLR